MKFARKVLIKITDQRDEILPFFENGLTNRRTEGFNRLAKLIQRNARPWILAREPLPILRSPDGHCLQFEKKLNFNWLTTITIQNKGLEIRKAL